MKLSATHLDITWEDKPANFARIHRLLERTPIEPGSLLILPEMFATGFSLHTDITAEPVTGETHQFLASLARQTKSTILGGVARTEPNKKPTNRSPVYSPAGELLSDYAKLHPFTAGKEPQHFSRGESLAPFEWQNLTVVPTICYDLRFPELYRRAAQLGAHLITVIANWPSTREHHWITLLQARAIENQCFIAGCNRTGHDPHLPYSGHSLIIDPKGQILADAGSHETIISADINLDTLTIWRNQFPAL